MNKFRRWLLKLVMFELAVTKIEPGDTVVFKTPDHLSVEDQEHIHEGMRTAFPHNSHLIIIKDDTSIEVIKGADTDRVALEEGTYSIDYIDHRTVRLRKVAI